jgi:hypothetical protein
VNFLSAPRFKSCPQGLSWDPTCGKLLYMEKPHLVIVKEIDGNPIQGTCSSCKDVLFNTSATAFARERKEDLRNQFREHFRHVHEREDAGQAAARIAREATGNK